VSLPLLNSGMSLYVYMCPARSLVLAGMWSLHFCRFGCCLNAAQLRVAAVGVCTAGWNTTDYGLQLST
jgi:hypothetical protein